MNYWAQMIQALGSGKDDSTVKDLFLALGEVPAVSETPDIYNDPQGRTLFYKFTVSGLEFGFRSGRLNHIHIFVQGHEGYSAYRADILDRGAQIWDRDALVKHLGPPQDEAPGKLDALIGHTHGWARYEFATYDLRMEFSDDGRLWKATLMVK